MTLLQQFCDFVRKQRRAMPDKPTFSYALVRFVIRVTTLLTGGMVVRGAEHIPESGPVILAPNHRAHVDPPLLSLISPRPLCFMAKDELFRVPVFGKFIRAMGAFPVKRGTADRAALKRAIELLKAGRVVVIFPEGTRSEDGTLRTAEKGFALIAKQTGAPIVPVAIEGTERLLPKGSARLGRARVQITVGPALRAQEILAAQAGQEQDALTTIGEATMTAIAALLPTAAPPEKKSEKVASTP